MRILTSSKTVCTGILFPTKLSRQVLIMLYFFFLCEESGSSRLHSAYFLIFALCKSSCS